MTHQESHIKAQLFKMIKPSTPPLMSIYKASHPGISMAETVFLPNKGSLWRQQPFLVLISETF